ncbi:MAG TPA: transcriptional regulator [Erysipelotrichaceae bacterium]|nr:transcriptional regulator [Erysipelotrichaceae bacterium]
MIFSSNLFIFQFLPIIFLLLLITPKKYQNLILFIGSLIFYAWGEVRYIFIMFASVLVDYVCSNQIEKNRLTHKTRIYLWISVFFNLGMLFAFKYSNFFISNLNALFDLSFRNVNLTLPLGISFYTFQTMSYTIDVYRNKVKADSNIIDFGAYVCLFPQLIAGPIVRYSDIAIELKSRVLNFENMEKGIRIFLLGLSSKVLLANNIGMLWDEIILLPNPSTITLWLGLIAFGFQIYFDFSGYSLMAIGLGRMLGFHFPDNFNYPYISQSMTDFWNRWHITLGSWFKEYVYIPLGGNRKGALRLAINLFIVWFLTGFWHGAEYNFILWGLYFYVLLIAEKFLLLPFLRKHPILSRLYFIPLILLGWAIFAISDLSLLAQYIATLFSLTSGYEWIYYLQNYGVILLLCFVFATPVGKWVINKINSALIQDGLLYLSFIIAVAYLVDSSYNPFLYFRF